MQPIEATRPVSVPLIDLNVGGTRITAPRDQLTRYPASRLAGWVDGSIPADRDAKGRIFIDSDPQVFRHIMAHLRSGPLPPLDATELAQVEEASRILGLEESVGAEAAIHRAWEALAPERGKVGEKAAGLRMRLIEAFMAAGHCGRALDVLAHTHPDDTNRAAGVCMDHYANTQDPAWLALAAFAALDETRAEKALQLDPDNPLCQVVWGAGFSIFGPDGPHGSTSDGNGEDLLRAVLADDVPAYLKKLRAGCAGLGDSGWAWGYLARILLFRQVGQDTLCAPEANWEEKPGLGASGTETLWEAFDVLERATACSHGHIEHVLAFWSFYVGESTPVAPQGAQVLEARKPLMIAAMKAAAFATDPSYCEGLFTCVTQMRYWRPSAVEAHNQAIREAERQYREQRAMTAASPETAAPPPAGQVLRQVDGLGAPLR